MNTSNTLGYGKEAYLDRKDSAKVFGGNTEYSVQNTDKKKYFNIKKLNEVTTCVKNIIIPT